MATVPRSIFCAFLFIVVALIALFSVKDYSFALSPLHTISGKYCNELESIRMILPRMVNCTYSETAMETTVETAAVESPRMDYWHHSMVRLGTDLRFDINQCPLDSQMLANREFTPRHLDCPSLFIVGARKGGTSSLYQYISQHPDFKGIRLNKGPRVGETFYFCRNDYVTKPWKKYISMFPPGNAMTGDSSVCNLVHVSSPKRIYQSCGKRAKVVMLFRNPVDRLESNYLMRVRISDLKYSNISSFVKLHSYKFRWKTPAVNAEDMPKEWSKLVGLFGPASNMVFEGLYYVHLLNWICNFPAENILILNSEEFYRNSSKILDIVFQFLELKRLDSDAYNLITSVIYNQGHYAVPRLSNRDRASLLRVYRPFNKALSELLQWNISQWN